MYSHLGKLCTCVLEQVDNDQANNIQSTIYGREMQVTLR